MFGSKKKRIEELKSEISSLQNKIVGLHRESISNKQEYERTIEELKHKLFIESTRNRNHLAPRKNKTDIFYDTNDKISELTSQLNAEKSRNQLLKNKIATLEEHCTSLNNGDFVLFDEYVKLKIELKENNATILEMQKTHIEEINQITEDFKKILSNKPDKQNEEIHRLRKKIVELTSQSSTPQHPVNIETSSTYINRRPPLDELHNIRMNYKQEISDLEIRLDDLETLDKSIVKNELADIILYYSWKEISLLADTSYKYIGIQQYSPNYKTFDELKQSMKNRFMSAIADQYKYKFILQLYPEFNSIFKTNYINKGFTFKIKDIRKRTERLLNVVELVNTLESLPNYLGPTNQMREKIETLTKKAYGPSLQSEQAFLELQSDYQILKQENSLLSKKYSLLESKTNLSAIPYMARLAADFETYELEQMAKSLDWGNSKERAKKVKSIREIRQDTKAMIEKYKEAEYQLAYLLKLYPVLEEVIECEFNELPSLEVSDLSKVDKVKDFLTKEEYNSLSITERNQLALDRYINSHNKSKWQIGRDYEQYVGYIYTQQGYEVNNFGTYMGLEDLGRDIIAKKDNETLVIQCKYWSSLKLIHEKHITQLYGTVASYCVENNMPKYKVKGLLVTNIKLSDMAKKMAKHLHVDYEEDVAMGDYPCIKCNIGHDSDGKPTKIYHLPFDQQYDNTKIEPHKGEFYAVTVKEAEDAGFRRAFKHFNK